MKCRYLIFYHKTKLTYQASPGLWMMPDFTDTIVPCCFLYLHHDLFTQQVMMYGGRVQTNKVAKRAAGESYRLGLPSSQW